jgi:hypothetical protein
MSYMTLLILSFSFMILPPTVFQRAPLGNREYVLQREQVHQHTHVQPAPVLIVLEGPPDTTEKQKSGRSEKNATTTEKQKTTVPEQREKNVPVKDFVPTEKIRADKAVDFPADI